VAPADVVSVQAGLTRAELPEVGLGRAGMDAESARWVCDLTSAGAEREAAAGRLQVLLLRVARSEVHRRSGQLQLSGPEADDLAHQAADDAAVAVLSKVGQFRGDSRFTTWAYSFVVFEVSGKVGRHMWQHPTVAMAGEDWDQLPDRFGLDPADRSQWRDLVDALHRAVVDVLTVHQRRVFVAIVLAGVPVDALAVELDSTRNALYKTMFDARRKLRASLVATGHLDGPPDHETDTR